MLPARSINPEVEKSTAQLPHRQTIRIIACMRRRCGFSQAAKASHQGEFTNSAGLGSEIFLAT